MGIIAHVLQVVDAIKLPVVAVGGIADAGAAFALGTSGVKMGAVFHACDRSSASLIHRKALLNDRVGTSR